MPRQGRQKGLFYWLGWTLWWLTWYTYLVSLFHRCCRNKEWVPRLLNDNRGGMPYQIEVTLHSHNVFILQYFQAITLVEDEMFFPLWCNNRHAWSCGRQPRRFVNHHWTNTFTWTEEHPILNVMVRIVCSVNNAASTVSRWWFDGDDDGTQDTQRTVFNSSP